MSDQTKQKLIDKIIDETSDLELDELCEKFKLDLHDLIDQAIQTKLEYSTIDQLINYL